MNITEKIKYLFPKCQGMALKSEKDIYIPITYYNLINDHMLLEIFKKLVPSFKGFYDIEELYSEYYYVFLYNNDIYMFTEEDINTKYYYKLRKNRIKNILI